MKTYGDISSEDKRILEELQMLEAWFYEHGSDLPLLQVAKGMVCMAHDYYELEMEEEGDRLLKLADSYCPMYFSGPIHSHIYKSQEFSALIESLTSTLGYDMMIALGYEK